MGRSCKKIKKLFKHMYMECFTDNLRGCSAHLKKLQKKEKSEKCEINCRPSVLRSPTVQRLVMHENLNLCHVTFCWFPEYHKGSLGEDLQWFDRWTIGVFLGISRRKWRKKMKGKKTSCLAISSKYSSQTTI